MRNSAVIIVLLISILGRTAFAQVAAVPKALEPMSFLVGSWNCEGVFPSSGKTISSRMTFNRDLEGMALVKHHDDTSQPAAYHAIELWGYNSAVKQFSAAIQDNFGGVREFTSPGWAGDALIWTSAASVKPPQQFAYKKISNDAYSVDWRVSPDGTTYIVGDTLNCKRS